MKNSGVCPKCGCTKIVGPHGSKLIDLLHFRTATLKALVCSGCGYAEWYSDELGLDNVRRLGEVYKVPQSKSSQPSGQRVCLFCNCRIQPDDVICPECGKNI
ncbi:hypothetical protein EU528_01355 [Candidatus Thorarchaeota archaeon]|nr:MAG: hypothetical protein EU528_01355 [Candidatus Thorarchaeota archaeon]